MNAQSKFNTIIVHLLEECSQALPKKLNRHQSFDTLYALLSQIDLESKGLLQDQAEPGTVSSDQADPGVVEAVQKADVVVVKREYFNLLRDAAKRFIEVYKVCYPMGSTCRGWDPPCPHKPSSNGRGFTDLFNALNPDLTACPQSSATALVNTLTKRSL